ncbi:unnamed protein product [Symbiodinium natans]|uniref:G domain-containing protein n=1 Tax=Symbiodinium natans TaxID=878477 RepID=A0A812LQA3_9DINO|nr:unnamed protein product [Symbiodinium natans]
MAVQSAVVIFGPTQAGKSTVVDFLTEGDTCIPIGDGDGHSVTAEAQLYDGTKLGCPMPDTPGINDTLMRFTNAEAGARVALGVAHARPKSLKFIITDSLANDSMQLNNTLETFTLAFGREVLPSVVVLATKADLRKAAARERRVTGGWRPCARPRRSKASAGRVAERADLR